MEGKMDFHQMHAPFQSVSQWHTWQLGMDLAPQPDPETAPRLSGADQLWRFLHDLLAELNDDPGAFGAPQQPYETYVEPLDPKDSAAEKRIRERRLAARKAIDLGPLDFLYNLGQVGKPQGEGLVLRQEEYERLLDESTRKSKNHKIASGLECLGWSLQEEGTQVTATNPRYPGMPAVLAPFSQACAALGKQGFYFFRRGDLGVLAGKTQPEFEDALGMAPPALRESLNSWDIWLRECKFKRQVLASEWGGGGYRVRYSKKGDQLVVWSRVYFSHYPPVFQAVRWDFASGLTEQLFSRLEQTHPGMAGSVLDGIWKCTHCYENCGILATLSWNGADYEVCPEAGWQVTINQPGDVDILRQVISTLDE
jgi:hypothetical protein